MKLQYVELTSINDKLLLPWLDLYETSFPPEEKILVSRFLRYLDPDFEEDGVQNHLVAAVNEHGEFVGLMFYRIRSATGAFSLWYLATLPELRGNGVGAQCYLEVVRRAQEKGSPFVVFEVEVPEASPDAELARRRIGFYRRLGAKLLGGIRLVQKMGIHASEVQMNVMIHPLTSITPQQAFDIAAEYVDNEGLSQIGELALD
ncbi:MAG: GNAT family N-acetyltransferase [Armatimonadota bacterium]|jgi:ribosomal protein S18 acetylase RimI-like enzyme